MRREYNRIEHIASLRVPNRPSVPGLPLPEDRENKRRNRRWLSSGPGVRAGKLPMMSSHYRFGITGQIAQFSVIFA